MPNMDPQGVVVNETAGSAPQPVQFECPCRDGLWILKTFYKQILQQLSILLSEIYNIIITTIVIIKC